MGPRILRQRIFQKIEFKICSKGPRKASPEPPNSKWCWEFFLMMFFFVRYGSMLWEGNLHSLHYVSKSNLKFSWPVGQRFLRQHIFQRIELKTRPCGPLWRPCWTLSFLQPQVRELLELPRFLAHPLWRPCRTLICFGSAGPRTLEVIKILSRPSMTSYSMVRYSMVWYGAQD